MSYEVLLQYFDNSIYHYSYGKPKNLLAMDNYLFFVADFNDGHAIRLAKTDGTTAGTQMFKDINPSGNFYALFV